MKQHSHGSVIEELKSHPEKILDHPADDPAEIRRPLADSIQLSETSGKERMVMQEHLYDQERQRCSSAHLAQEGASVLGRDW